MHGSHMGMLISIRGILNIGKQYFFSQKVVYLYLALLAGDLFGMVSSRHPNSTVGLVTFQRLGLKRSRLEPPGIGFSYLEILDLQILIHCNHLHT